MQNQPPKRGETYWCDPDPHRVDTVGSEQMGDRIWLVVSHNHRGKCVVALPLSRHVDKADDIPWLIKVPADQMTMVDGNPAINRIALTDQIRCIDKSRLGRRSGSITARALFAIFDGLDYLFGRQSGPQKSN